MRLKTYTFRETERLGERLARRTLRSGQSRKARVVALIGDLGSGKTTFARGFLRGLGIKQKTASPTFILIRRFTLRHKRFTNAFHVDTYRLKRIQDWRKLNFESLIKNPHHIILIEWADKIKKLLPRSAVWVKFSHGRKENERMIYYH